MVNWHEISRYVRQYQSAAHALEARFAIPRDRLDDLPDCRGDDGQQLVAIELADLADVIEKKRNPPVPVVADE